MADEIDVESFLDLLRQSELVSDSQMASLVAEFRGDGPKPAGGRELADELVKRGILTVWQADNLMQGKHRGFRLGPYRILRPLGQGGMSKVFLAEHEVMCRCCAIKVLPGRYEDDSDLLNRFRLEARAVAALDHPNIVRAYDFNKDERQEGKSIHYLVMEYVEGSDLRRMIDEQGPLDYHKAAEYICQAAEGLAHAHAAGFVHRDIKPANLMVDPHGVLKILDLGLARFDVEVEGVLTPSEGSQAAVGTADYIAPEQVVDSRTVDGRADIYSLGLTFYFLLTGRRPFSKPTITELLKAHQTEQPAPIGNTRPDVPLELETIIDKMIAKSPFQRFQSAKELAEKLRTWLRDSGSGRGYSRISTLMAEALRAKQQAGHEPSRPKSDPTKEVDLQLAPADDEPARSHSSVVLKSGGSGKVEAFKEGSSSAIRKMSPPGSAQAAEPAEEAALPTLKADLLSVPLAEVESAPALPNEPDAAATAGSPTLQNVPAAQARDKKKGNGSLAASGALVGVAGGAVVVVVGVLLFLFGPWSGNEPANPPVSVQPISVTPPPPVQVTQPPPKPPEPPKAEPSKSDDKRSGQGTRKSTKPPVDKNAPNTKPPPTSGSKELASTKPANEKPAPSPTPSEDLEKDKNTPPDGEKPSTPDKSVAKKQTPKPLPQKAIDKEELLAGISNIQFNVTVIDEKFKPSILIQATAAADTLKLNITDKDAATMKIDLTMSTEAGASGLMLSAELKCPSPNGKPITVWQLKKLAVSGDPLKIQPAPVTVKNLQTNCRQFFNEFIKAVHQAQKKFPPE